MFSFLWKWFGSGSVAGVAAARAVVLRARDCGRVLTANDCGRVLMAGRCSWTGTICLRVGEVRTLGIDFAELDELENGDSITSGSVAVITSGSGVVVGAATVDGTVVVAVFDAVAGVVAPADLLSAGGEGHTDYTVEVEAQTLAGATLGRSFSLRMEE